MARDCLGTPTPTVAERRNRGKPRPWHPSFVHLRACETKPALGSCHIRVSSPERDAGFRRRDATGSDGT